MDPLSSSSIPVMRAPNDLMKNGLNSDNLAAAAVQTHPVDRMQRAAAASDSLDLDAIRRLYGSALAMRLTTERQNAMAVGGRLPGLDAHPNSHTMYETLTGDDITINFGDFLNVAQMRPEGRVGSGRDEIHSAMESRLGL